MMRHILLTILFMVSLGGWVFGQQIASPSPSPDDKYELGPDSQQQAGVPEGKVMEFLLENSTTYPGFKHRWWLYIPTQYDGKKPVPVMVFQDGMTYAAQNHTFRVPVVLNNLIAKKELPVMAAVFVEPGQSKEIKAIQNKNAPDGSPLINGASDLEQWSRPQRTAEYATLSDKYASFLINEILPKVRKHVKITNDPDGRGIAGHSNGGICAFTVAWERPEQFRKVFSSSGGATIHRRPLGSAFGSYPDLVRNSDKKPLRVFLQVGARDIPGFAEGNRALVAALEEKDYDHRFVFGEGSHNTRHAGSIFPEVMRWLWRDYPPRSR
jgi:enterochelin esterase-like enzyme